MITLVTSLAGSRLYGTHHANSDTDLMSIGVATQQEKLGLNYVEQIGADDDVTYELAKWARLAVNGNPTVLQMLWVKPAHLLAVHPGWPLWQMKLRKAVLSQRCIPAFLGYLDGQRRKVISGRGQRPQLIEQFGYDTKFAAHMVRLGYQGNEVNQTGMMTLPCAIAPVLTDIIAGKFTQKEVLDMAATLEDQLKTTKSILPAQIDAIALDKLLTGIYTECWS